LYEIPKEDVLAFRIGGALLLVIGGLLVLVLPERVSTEARIPQDAVARSTLVY
jgi:hypothetical protein